MNKVLSVWMFSLGAVLVLAAGCTEYKSIDNGEDDCAAVTECNPGKTCGILVACVDGKCDPEQTVDLPCNQGCSSDDDCPAGMHCQVAPNDANQCVADGACMSVSECLDYPEADCLGIRVCEDGACGYVCLADDQCGSDSDCVLADLSCCCGNEADDYLAVHRDRLPDWRGRPGCWAVDCPAVECIVPDDLTAVCQQGSCAVDREPLPTDCQQDSDCVKVPGDCCGCEFGGLEGAVLVSEEQDYLDQLQEQCALIDLWCPPFSTCTERPAVCREGTCQVEGDWCECNDEYPNWDPVCVNNASGQQETIPNACMAECLGFANYFPGRCDCMMDCFRADPYCGTNGHTYYCGEFELECNGQQVHYPGECLEACEVCDMLGRPSIPVCGADFRDYNDMCYAECHELSYWHTGFCLAGEGNVCGTIAGTPCPSEELACAYEDLFPDAGGVCVKRGSCIHADHCIGQGLPADDCVGEWICQDHTCLWQCD